MQPGHHLDIRNAAHCRRDLHAGLVRNLRKVGVLAPRIEPDLAALGISLAAA
jgi:hypothetical protein